MISKISNGNVIALFKATWKSFRNVDLKYIDYILNVFPNKLFLLHNIIIIAQHDYTITNLFK